MNIRKTSIVGFTQIFTPDHPDTEGIFITDKPSYIIFIMPVAVIYETKTQKEDLNKLYLTKTLVREISALGMPSCKKNNYVITITGDRKVAAAISLFKQLTEYPAEQNKELLIYLDQYQATCEKQYKSKPKKIPSKSKPLSSFTNKDGSKLDLTSAKKRSYNQTLFLKEINSENKWVLKLYSGNRTIANFEVFSGEISELILGSRAPETIGIHGEEGERIGSASRFYNRYINIRDYITSSNKKIDADLIVSSEMIKVFALIYITHEIDANPNNYGFVKFLDRSDNTIKFLGVNIDHDRKLWEIVCPYFGVDPNAIETHSKLKPIDFFPIRTLKISSFPWTQYKPDCWIDNPIFYETDSWETAAKNEKFIRDKYYIFLKIAIIPQDIIENIADAIFYSNNKKNLAAGKVIKIIEDLRFAFDNDLENDKEVKKYLISHQAKELFLAILGEFKEYNQRKKEAGLPQLQVDLKKVAENFHHLRANAKRNLCVFPRAEIIPHAADPSLPLVPVVPTTPSTPQTPNNENVDPHASSKKRQHDDSTESSKNKRPKLNPVLSSTTKNNTSNTTTSSQSSGSRTVSLLRTFLAQQQQAGNNLQASNNTQLQPIQYHGGMQSSIPYNWQQQPTISTISLIPATSSYYQPRSSAAYSGIPTGPAIQYQQPRSSAAYSIPTGSAIQQYQQPNSSAAYSGIPTRPAIQQQYQQPNTSAAYSIPFTPIMQAPQRQPTLIQRPQQQPPANVNTLPAGFPIDPVTFSKYPKSTQALYLRIFQQNNLPQQQPTGAMQNNNLRRL